MSGVLGNYLTTNELAAELKRSPATISRWRRLRIGPAPTNLHGRVLYDLADVRSWIEAQKANTGQQASA